MRLCNTCGAMRGDRAKKCQHCGNTSSYYVPSEENLADGCAEIQAKWSKAKELFARRLGQGQEPPLETPVVSRHQQGRRVIRDLKREDEHD